MGLAQCAELTWQLRGTARPRQVEGVTAALQHNIGLGGATVVTMYRTPNPQYSNPAENGLHRVCQILQPDRFGYEPIPLRVWVDTVAAVELWGEAVRI